MAITWKAIYNNGMRLPQFNEDGSENKYPEIDRSRLSAFEIYNMDKLILRIHFEKGRRLIYRKRVSRGLSGKQQAIYLIGWQQTIAGQNIQDIAYVFEDGHIELAGKWKEDHRWFYAPNLIAVERNG